MLLNLHIKNYTLIDELSLECGPGLTICTGETGAGKSIIIESLGLLLGERASAQAVRAGAPRCSLTGTFNISRLSALKAHLADAGLAGTDPDELILRREIDAGGKSRAFVNDTPAGMAALGAISDFLVDIHGQHDHQSLFDTAAQRHLLDTASHAEDLATAVRRSYDAWRALADQQNAHTLSEQEKNRLIDLYSFQLREIDDAALVRGEEEEIEEALPRMKNAEKLGALCGETMALLRAGDGAALERLGRARRLIETIQGLGVSVGDTAELLAAAQAQLEEAAANTERLADGLSADPETLNELLGRQVLIHKLKKKYGAGIDEILATRDRVAAELAALTGSEENARERERAVAAAKAALVRHCAALTAARAKGAETLAKAVVKELNDLAMKKAQFAVRCAALPEPGPDGADTIEFLFSANPGEQPAPLRTIASGGEMSRVMLAIKTVLAKADRVPVLVFDEIDAGIGGQTGETVGRKLAELARHHQVLCITHLPQIAAFAQQHWAVAKITAAGRTATAVRVLSPADRAQEIARMISGQEITDAARRHAAELIETARAR